MKCLRVVAILVLLGVPAAKAQTPIGTTIRFEIENSTLYLYDCPYNQLGTSPNKLDHARPTGGSAFGVGDIVSVNGAAIKGTSYESFSGFVDPTSVDSTHAAVAQWDFDFLYPDGTEIGTIHADGFQGGVAPPGAPQAIPNAAWIVTGGSGAFFGVRGYFSAPNVAGAGERITSACEDPRLRRTFSAGAGKRHGVLYLVPLEAPQIIMNGNTPAVVHASDGTLVTTVRPAKAGEVLTLYASGLGPTRPGVEPGRPFTADPPQVVNSPVQVLLNGSPGDVLYAGGYPGAVDGYQVNFRVPDGTAPGQAALQLTSAWIGGPLVNVPVQ